jgi:hypothetical protein
VPEISNTGPISGEVRRRKATNDPIPAKVLAVDKQGDQYNVIVRIGLAKYRGSFNTLAFGENKPSIGFCHEGRLDLVCYKDPGLEAGKSFPLWTVL